LAKLASLNAKQCEMKHDLCRNTVKFKTVGQNIGYRASSSNFESTTNFIRNVINAWYNEIADAKQSELNSCCGTNLKKVGHFLQMMQDNAHYIGCAAVKYTRGQWKSLLLVCNYSHGNVRGSKVYQTGRPASACSKRGKSSKYPALCN
jgi:Cysteine-rich secretory protein family